MPEALAPIGELTTLVEPCIAERAKRAIEACQTDPACVERERTHWTAAAATLDAARLLWCAHFEHPACTTTPPEPLP